MFKRTGVLVLAILMGQAFGSDITGIAPSGSGRPSTWEESGCATQYEYCVGQRIVVETLYGKKYGMIIGVKVNHSEDEVAFVIDGHPKDPIFESVKYVARSNKACTANDRCVGQTVTVGGTGEQGTVLGIYPDGKLLVEIGSGKDSIKQIQSAAVKAGPKPEMTCKHDISLSNRTKFYFKASEDFRLSSEFAWATDKLKEEKASGGFGYAIVPIPELEQELKDLAVQRVDLDRELNELAVENRIIKGPTLKWMDVAKDIVDDCLNPATHSKLGSIDPETANR